MQGDCNCNSKQNTSVPDLTTSDWLLATTEKFIKSINPNISVSVGSGKMSIMNVQSEDLKNIFFITHNANNNNYLKFEKFTVSIKGSNYNILCPGFNDIVGEIYKYTDTQALLNNQQYFIPFVDVESTLEKYSDLAVFLPKFKGVSKTYNIFLASSV